MSFHALDRYRQHHPTANPAALEAALQAGDSIDGDLVQALCGRTGPASPEDRFILAPDSRGVFVLVGKSLRTYLRLGNVAQRILRGQQSSTEDDRPTTGRKLEGEARARLFTLFSPWDDTRVFFDASGDDRFDLFLIIARLTPTRAEERVVAWRLAGEIIEAFYDPYWAEITISRLAAPEEEQAVVVTVHYPNDPRVAHLLAIQDRQAVVRIAPPGQAEPRGKLRLVPLKWVVRDEAEQTTSAG
ncbi:MAG: hypothetical protein ACI9U2_001613 [Bradymonadia bacterium]